MWVASRLTGPGGGVHRDDGAAGYLFYIWTQYRRIIFSRKIPKGPWCRATPVLFKAFWLKIPRAV